ncbi:hypothetical protein M9Y10_023260 [Tritrichomonas musculus]|uniref:NAD-dependent protein deacetylase n=1 Tax=Tritrichomonas musculus TaxID=1915356 RepID=A0ABR2KV87_9EUKA
MIREKSIHLLSKFIKEIKNSKIIILHGAGVSVAAGIPDFRTPGTGFYSRVEKLGLPQPESIFDIGFFEENPNPFYSIANELRPGKFKPTYCHYFAKLLENKNKLLRLYTQNIDGLEKLAGLSEERLCEAHGHFRSAHCTQCKSEASIEEVNKSIDEKKPFKCTQCGGYVKPDIVFYGENLPERFFTLSEKDFQKDSCQLLITIGTSLKVYPFASLASYSSKGVPRFLINNEEAGDFSFSNSESNDYFIKGDCQQAITDLSEDLGWSNELNNLKKSFLIK